MPATMGLWAVAFRNTESGNAKSASGAKDDWAGSSAAEGVSADRDGIIYSTEVGPRRVMRYVRKRVESATRRLG